MNTILAYCRKNDIKGFCLYLFAWAFISVRFLTETTASDIHEELPWLYFHHHLWFYAVFAMYMIVFRYIVGVSVKKIPRFLLAAPLLMIPVCAHYLSGNKVMGIDYISARHPASYIYNIATFMLFNPQNRPVSYELIIIFIGVTALAYYLSHSITRSIGSAVVTYLVLMVVHGTIWIAPESFSEALIRYPSHLQSDIAFASLYLSVVVLYIFILFFPEIKRTWLPLLDIKTGIAALLFFTLFYLLLFLHPPLRFSHPPTMCDMVTMWTYPFVFTIFFISIRTSFLGVKLLAGAFTLIVSVMLLLIYHPEWELTKAKPPKTSVKNTNEVVYDTVVVGAGIAGLDAAFRLNGPKTLLLEKTGRIGGRIYTRTRDGIFYELGALFFHDTTALPFRMSNTSVVKEPALVGFFKNNKPWLGPTVLASMKQHPEFRKEAAPLTALAQGNIDSFSLLSDDAKQVVGAFFNTINPGDLSQYDPRLIPAAFSTFNIDHFSEGVQKVAAEYRKRISGPVLLNARVLSVDDKGDKVAVIYRQNAKQHTVYAKAVVVTTPAPIARNIIKKQNPKAAAFLASVTYGAGLAVVLAVRDSHLPAFRYIATPEQSFGVIYQMHTKYDGVKLLTIYYLDRWVQQHKNLDDRDIVNRTVQELIKMGFVKKQDILFSDTKWWVHLGTIVNQRGYAHFSSDSVRPSRRVFLAGDYTVFSPNNPLAYGVDAAIESGKAVAEKVRHILKSAYPSNTNTLPQSHHLSHSSTPLNKDIRNKPPSNANALSQSHHLSLVNTPPSEDIRNKPPSPYKKPLFRCTILSVGTVQPRYLRTKNFGDIAYYGELLLLSRDPDLARYLTSVATENLYEFHHGFGYSLLDSTLVLEGLLETNGYKQSVIRSMDTIIREFYDKKQGAFTTVNGARTPYWNGVDVDATAQAAFLLHRINAKKYREIVARSAEFVARHQQPNGSWQSKWFPLRTFTPFYAIRLLLTDKKRYKTELHKARMYILSLIDSSGSVNQSVMETAGALRILNLFSCCDTQRNLLRTWLSHHSPFTGNDALLFYRESSQLFVCSDRGKIAESWKQLALLGR